MSDIDALINELNEAVGFEQNNQTKVENNGLQTSHRSFTETNTNNWHPSSNTSSGDLTKHDTYGQYNTSTPEYASEINYHPSAQSGQSTSFRNSYTSGLSYDDEPVSHSTGSSILAQKSQSHSEVSSRSNIVSTNESTSSTNELDELLRLTETKGNNLLSHKLSDNSFGQKNDYTSHTTGAFSDSTANSRCTTTYLGNASSSQGITRGQNRRACDHLHCLNCDFAVTFFPHAIWSKSADYMFFRNRYPNVNELRQMIIESHGDGAYACQCSWRSVLSVGKHLPAGAAYGGAAADSTASAVPQPSPLSVSENNLICIRRGNESTKFAKETALAWVCGGHS